VKNNINLVAVILILIVIGCKCPDPKDGSSTGSTPTASDSSTPKLELLSSRGERNSFSLKITGQVKNISGEKLETVNVVVDSYGANGELISSETSFLEYNPLMPGQTSPFTAIVQENPLIKNYKINFKHFAGEQIPHTDSRPKESPKETKKKK